MNRQQVQQATNRVEALSDGVFAIAMTLLSLDLTAAFHHGEALAVQLPRMWPSFLAFHISFLTINVVWINHHRLFRHIRHANHTLMLFNGLLLLTVTVVPFATVVLAANLIDPVEGKTAAMVYNLVFIALTGSFNLVWRHASRTNLLHLSADRSVTRRINLQYGFGPALYVVAFCLAAWSHWASIIADVAIVFLYSLPLVRAGHVATRDGLQAFPHG